MANAISITSESFPGTLPSQSDGRQVNRWAVRSHNVRRHVDYLRAMPKPRLVCEVGADIRTIYETKECDCITWDTCVDIAEIPCRNPDDEHQVMWTGDGRPYMGTESELCAGERCAPGPPCPVFPVNFSAPGCTDPGCNAQQFTYVITYKNKYGDESAPGPPSPVQTGDYSSGVTLTLPPTPPQLPNFNAWCVEEICIYRLGVGFKSGQEDNTATNTGFWLIDCVPIGTTTYFDDMSKPKPFRLQTQGMHPMPATAVNLVSVPGGQTAWTRGSSVVLSPPMRPGQYGVTNQSYEVDLKCDVACLIEHGGRLWAITEDGQVFRLTIQVSTGRFNIQVFEYRDCSFPVCSKQSVVKTKEGVYYASTDGLVVITGEGPQYVAQEVFTREQWCNECCEGMVMGSCYGDLILRGKYNTYLIPREVNGYYIEDGVGVATLDIKPDTFYTRRDGTVLFAQDGNVYELPKCTDQCCDCCDAVYETRIFRASCPISFEAMRLWMRPEYGAVTVCLYAFDCGVRRLIHEREVDSCEPFMLPHCGEFNHWQMAFKFCGAWVDGWELAPDIAQFGETSAA